jgi:hypothetical protein
MKAPLKLIIAVFICFFALPFFAKSQSHWEPLEFLIGKWEQQTEATTVIHNYEYIMDGQFIKSETDAKLTIEIKAADEYEMIL